MLKSISGLQMKAAERAKIDALSPPQLPADIPAASPSDPINPPKTAPADQPIIVPTVPAASKPTSGGMVKTFNPNGPPSLHTNSRFAVTSRANNAGGATAPRNFNANNAGSART